MNRTEIHRLNQIKTFNEQHAALLKKFSEENKDALDRQERYIDFLNKTRLKKEEDFFCSSQKAQESVKGQALWSDIDQIEEVQIEAEEIKKLTTEIQTQVEELQQRVEKIINYIKGADIE